MYGVKAFCHARLKDHYDLLIRRALESVAFAEVVEKKEAFVLGKLISFSEYNLTRDGLFPTESEDKAVIHIRMMDTEPAGVSYESKVSILKEEMKKYTANPTQNIKVERVGEGHYISTKVEDGKKQIFGAYITDGNGINNLFIGTCNNSETIDDIAFFIRNQNIKSVLDVR